MYTSITVADRTQAVVAENLANAVGNLRAAAALMAKQATQITFDLNTGNNPTMVYGQTVNDLVTAQGAFTSALAVARRILTSNDLQAIVESAEEVFITAIAGNY